MLTDTKDDLVTLENLTVQTRSLAYDEYCPSVSAVVHEMSESFGRAIDAKDPFTKNHSDEVAVVSQALALVMGFSPQRADAIHIAGHLHDIGKIGVPDSVLGKTTPLLPEEWELIKKHPDTGAAILAPVEAMACLGVPELVRCHHERFDGRGYPRKLAGGDIPLGARIIAVADSLSAMLQGRSYRDGMAFDDACREIERCAGAQFDPAVVSAFLDTREHVRQMMQCVHAVSSNSLALE
jgi:HD-GYP domain-containing protein (c-di-GMP phosphodiesterase class II)